MAENARAPVAIRIVRPFDSEEALLEGELETIGKTSVILIGAHPRPTGVILRFEVTLQSGASVLRGEGRVLAHKENAFRGQSGLTLRFTRLDPKSKAVVDRATAIREARAAASAPPSPIADALSVETPEPMPVAATSPKPSAVEQEAAVQTALAAAREKANAQARLNAKRTSRTPPPLPSGATRVSLTPPPAPIFEEPEPPPPPPPVPVPEEPEPEPLPPVVVVAMAPIPAPPDSLPIVIAPDSEPAVATVEDAVTAIPGEVAPVTPPTTSNPPDRAALLARLRGRSAELSPERVQAILESAPQRRSR